ncbi:MAG TPA: uroporphyrinogen decarboxylase family protein [Candidatus Hydrogenedentes bacterium]|nr:uroporphyrinogen decarboxylase family protein [Candidatus Hydrogenedentota bacterium]
MTNRERVIASFNHQQPDKTPYCIEFTMPMHARMAEYYGDPNFADHLGNALTFLSTVGPDGWKEVASDIWEDEFGVQWNRSVDKDIGIVCNHMVTSDTIEEYVFPDPHDPRRYESFPDTIARAQGQFVLANIGFSLFERAWTLFGMEDLLIAMAAEPSTVHRLLDRILEHNLARIEHACTFEIDAMMFGDDWGSQRGLIMGPQMWREFIKPRVREMYQAVRKRGKYVMIHSCGKVDELFPELIECGLHCFNPFQPEVIDVFETKQRFGGELSFYGGISTQRTLPYGTVAQVKDEVRRRLEEVGKNGGYIAAPSHAIPPDAKPENVAAMIEALQQGAPWTPK